MRSHETLNVVKRLSVVILVRVLGLLPPSGRGCFSASMLRGILLRGVQILYILGGHGSFLLFHSS